MENKKKTNRKIILRKVKWKIKTIYKKINDGIIIRKIKQCSILTRSFFEALKDIFIIKKQDDTYVSLTPTKNADEDGVYCNALKYAIDNTEIKNIAITGNYGAGKSSVIKTFFEKLENKKYNPIYVSLAAFNKNDYLIKRDNGKEGEEGEKGGEVLKEIQNKNEFYHTLEKSILQQLLYQANEKDVPLSRFKRISKHSKILLNISTISVIVAITIIICIIFPNIIQGIKDNYNIITTEININIVNFFICISLIVIWYIMYKILFFLSTKFNISKFKFKDAEVEIDNKPESIFNKYLDEIIYFFQVSNHKVVVIEDLDRYEGDASFIFQKLRELNTLINSSNQVKYEVDFIFAIRDDFFENYEERTKFFDYIIPVIPISSSGNSNELIWNRLEKLKEAGKIIYKFDKSFIDDIAIMIEDKRLIDNILNEFIIYKNKFNNEHMDDKQLFSIIMYKNICPKDYSELQKDNGNIIDTLKNKKSKIKQLIQEMNNEKIKLENKKEEVEKESLKRIKELKLALVASIYDFNNYTGFEREFKFDNESVSINTFINTNISIDKISNSDISFRTKSHSYISLDEQKVFELFGNKSLFLNRLEVITKGMETKLEELQNEIEKINAKIRNINKIKIKQLINEYGEENIFEKDIKSIERFLISKGYITEEYKDYITLFIPGNLTREDMEFVFAVKTGETLPYDYELNNIKNVLKKLNESDFETISILNFDLLDYLVKNNITDKELKIIQLLDQKSQDALQFIDEFIEKYQTSKEFVTLLIENSIKLWKKIYKKIGNKEYVDKWVINFLSNEKSLVYIDENFIEYINKHKDIDKYITDDKIEVVINSFKCLGIRLSNIEKVTNEKFLKEIYENKLYQLNTNMIKMFLKMDNIDVERFSENNLSIIMNNENQLREHILNNFEEYFNLCYTLNKSNQDDESIIIEILNNTTIDINIKKKIIINEEFEEYDMKSIDENLIEIIVNEDKLKSTYANVLEIMTRIGKLESNVINHISKHIKDYSRQNINECESMYDREIIDLFINKYTFSKKVTLEDFKILVKTFDKKISRLEEIETSKLEYIIDNELIEFNNSNFDYIKSNISDKLMKYIIDNIQEFIEDLDEYDITDISDELLINKDIGKEHKLGILEHLNISNLENSTISKLILTDIIFVTDKTINERLLMDKNLPFNERISILKLLLKNIEDKEQVKNYIHLMQNGYEDINTSKNACNINSSYIDFKLCNLLKEKGYISSFKTGKKNNIILYNKVNRI
ncbi:MAG: hypothetical protein HFJ41_03465 [Clostridia bacterium]|nr:hypothetical protein [Clostridia bacterium]